MYFAIFKYKNEYHRQLELKKQLKKWVDLSNFLFSLLSYGTSTPQNSEFF